MTAGCRSSGPRRCVSRACPPRCSVWSTIRCCGTRHFAPTGGDRAAVRATRRERRSLKTPCGAQGWDLGAEAPGRWTGAGPLPPAAPQLDTHPMGYLSGPPRSGEARGLPSVDTVGGGRLVRFTRQRTQQLLPDLLGARLGLRERSRHVLEPGAVHPTGVMTAACRLDTVGPSAGPMRLGSGVSRITFGASIVDRAGRILPWG